MGPLSKLLAKGGILPIKTPGWQYLPAISANSGIRPRVRRGYHSF